MLRQPDRCLLVPSPWQMRLPMHKQAQHRQRLTKAKTPLPPDREPIVLHKEIPGTGRAKRYIITIADDDRAPLDRLCRKLSPPTPPATLRVCRDAAVPRRNAQVRRLETGLMADAPLLLIGLGEAKRAGNARRYPVRWCCDLYYRTGWPPIYLSSINHRAMELRALTILLSQVRGVEMDTNSTAVIALRVSRGLPRTSLNRCRRLPCRNRLRCRRERRWCCPQQPG